MLETTTAVNREHWLAMASEALQAAGIIAAKVPAHRVSCSWPSRKALGQQRRVGECAGPGLTTDNVAQVSVSPALVDPVDVLGVLTHELIHVVVPNAGHKGEFVTLMTAAGLEGKPTATVPGDRLRGQLTTIAGLLGPYPHAAINLSQKAKQTTRMVLWLCACDDPPKVRSAAGSGLDATCNVCGARLAPAGSGEEEGE